MKAFLISFLILFKFSDSSAAAPINGLREISIKIDGSNSRKFNYKYVVIDNNRAELDDKTTLVRLPGGPEASILEDLKVNSYLFPDNFRTVLIDYRGLGLNNINSAIGLTELDIEKTDTTKLALDVIAVLAAEKPKKYILFGQSFGTIIATKVAALAEQKGLQKPLAVVLEGTISDSPNLEEFQDVLNYINSKLKKGLPKNIFNWIKEPNVFGYDPIVWGQILFNLINREGIQFAIEQLKIWYQYATIGTPEQIETLKKDYIESLVLRRSQEKLYTPEENTNSKQVQKELIERLLITELRAESYFPIFEKGILKSHPPISHKDTFKNPFNSQNWQIPSPIYYIQGRGDFSTPYMTSLSHFQSQTKAPWAQFIIDLDGGHSPAKNMTPENRTEFWKAVEQGAWIKESLFPSAQVQSRKKGKNLCSRVGID